MIKSYSNKIFVTLIGCIVVLFISVLLVPLPNEIPQKSRFIPPRPVYNDIPVLVSFIGDSICVGADDKLNEVTRWPYLVSQKLKWFPINACVGGSGYLNAGPDGESTYMQVFDELSLKLRKPNIIIVEGGQNDLAGNTVADISSAACGLYAKIRKNFPNVDLIVMTPFYGLSEAPPAVSEVENAMKKCATKYKARVITGVRKWLQDHPELLIADETHPNGKGHALIANNFVAWFKANPSK
jgi:lysophospholipase L1-like esterase